jgi:hypothetical protein
MKASKKSDKPESQPERLQARKMSCNQSCKIASHQSCSLAIMHE